MQAPSVQTASMSRQELPSQLASPESQIARPLSSAAQAPPRMANSGQLEHAQPSGVSGGRSSKRHSSQSRSSSQAVSIAGELEQGTTLSGRQVVSNVRCTPLSNSPQVGIGKHSSVGVGLGPPPVVGSSEGSGSGSETSISSGSSGTCSAGLGSVSGAAAGELSSPSALEPQATQQLNMVAMMATSKILRVFMACFRGGVRCPPLEPMCPGASAGSATGRFIARSRSIELTGGLKRTRPLVLLAHAGAFLDADLSTSSSV